MDYSKLEYQKMKKVNKKRTLRREAKVFFILILSLFLTTVYLSHNNRSMSAYLSNELEVTKTEITLLESRNGEIRKVLDHSEKVVEVGAQAKPTEVIFTNYYQGDGSSGTTTASGLSINDFTVNERGMYLYDNKVVLAAGHKSLGNVKSGFKTYDLFQTLVFEIQNEIYTGIILDKCGECTWGNDHESLQRVDIFSTGNVIGKINGTVYE